MLSSSSNKVLAQITKSTKTTWTCSRNAQSIKQQPTAVNRNISYKTPSFQAHKKNELFTKLEFNDLQKRWFADGGKKIVKVPAMADSITEGTLIAQHKQIGESVKTDELIFTIETDKVAIEIRAQEDGVITNVFSKVDDVVKVGANLYEIDTSATASASSSKPKEQPKQEQPKEQPKQQEQPKPQQTQEQPKPQQSSPSSTQSQPQPVKTTSPSQNSISQSTEKQPPANVPKPSQPSIKPSNTVNSRAEHRQKISRMRGKISERLKGAQNTYAMLTTFQEVDMSNLMALRDSFKDEFFEKHGIKLGFMSAFVKASAIALQDQPTVNAVIDGDEILYRDYVDISVAVATPNGLVVPVVRNCENLSFAGIEKEIANLGKKARDGKIQMEDMAGGTFTISNGGVYGSLMGTPIINPPQSAILGMHAVNKRPVVVNDQIVIRPMMYLALTYDHRLIDGREGVTFLKKIKSIIEDPRRILLDV